MPTFPGLHPNFEVMRYPPQLRTALYRIAERFYVTRSFEVVNVGNSSYYAALIRPVEDTSIFLNTDRELVLLLSTYETFEIRTLEAYDKIYDLVDSARIDRSIRFLISADNTIETSIKHYLEKTPEYPVIIPVTLQAVISNANDVLSRAVRRNYTIRNLFGFQSPLREEYFFFGRDNLVNQVLDLAKSGQNTSLFGLRKSGKTSTIFAMVRKAPSANVLIINIDCQDLAVHGRRYDGLLLHVINQLRRAINIKQASFPSDLPLPELSERFSRELSSTLGMAKQPVMIVFDEIEHISPRTASSEHWRSGIDPVYFWQTLRSFMQANPNRLLSVCLVGTSPHLLETPTITDVDNPIYLYAEKRFIPNLSFDDTRLMVERLGYFMGLTFPPAIVAVLHQTYGGHPFFTRQVCSKIHQIAGLLRPLEVSLALLREAEEAFGNQLEEYLVDIVGRLQKFYPDEFALLVDLASGQRDDLEFFATQTPLLVDHLIGYGLIARRGEHFDVTFNAISRAVNSLAGNSKVKLDMETKWATMNVRRNKIEQAIRSTMYVQARSLAPDAWSELITKSLTTVRRSQLPTTAPSALFAKESSPLYVTDLMGLLEEDAMLPYLQDKHALIRHMAVMNRLRNDAHGKDISDRDYMELVSAFEALEAEFLV